MNWNAMQAIVRKDMKVVFQNKGVSIPLIAAPVVILVAFPAMVFFLGPVLGGMVATDSASSIVGMAAGLPGLAGYDEAQMMVVYLLVYMMAPLYLLLPTIVAIGFAADSFAGEKERKTLEALLYTPTTDWELLLGKLLSAWLPALGISWGGFLLYAVAANLAAWPVMGRLFFPTTEWLILAVWIAPAIAALGLGAMILISARARTFQAANGLAAVVVLPGLMLFGALLIAVMNSGAWLAALLGLLVWAVAAALIWFGRRSFERSRLAMEM